MLICQINKFDAAIKDQNMAQHGFKSLLIHYLQNYLKILIFRHCAGSKNRLLHSQVLFHLVNSIRKSLSILARKYFKVLPYPHKKSFHSFLCPYCTKLEPIFKVASKPTHGVRGNSEPKYPLGE